MSIVLRSIVIRGIVIRGIVVWTVPAAALVAVAALVAGCGSSHGSEHSSSSAASSAAGATTAVASPAAASAQGDIDFAQMMIPHHEQAVEMADMALAAESSADVQALAQQITSAQAPEIEQMRQWLADWGAAESAEGDHGDHGDLGHGDSMPGMMSDEDMDELMGATGPAFDRMWLEMMIAHHEGAITMATDVQSTSTRPEVLALAEAIITSQAAEIAQMKDMLATMS